ncbi:MAG: hypothetical protein GY751_00880 [Bacteroidetes bacterium]|nr:hypothetical protein [Bacteroidota bacterium]
MSFKNLPKAKLASSIPTERYRIISEKSNCPKEGDLVFLDQGFTDNNGEAMVLAYYVDDDDTLLYEAEVYESELV